MVEFYKPYVLYRVDVSGKDGRHRYFENEDLAREECKKVSIQEDETVTLERVETTAGKPIIEVLTDVFVRGKLFWQKTTVLDFFDNGVARSEEDDS